MRQAEPERLATLIRACAAGDRRAFASLYEATAPNLYAVVLRIVRREDWAQEVLQEVYLKVWRNADGYRPERAAATTWLSRIARNRAIDRLRRERPTLGDAEFPFDQLVDDGPGSEASLAHEEESATLRRCLEALPRQQAQCIEVAFFEGLTHPEVARRLRLPLGSVKTWIRRGLASIRACLER